MIGLWALAAAAVADTAAAPEPAVLLEVGGVGEWAVRGRGSHYGPSLAAEVTAIPGVLVVEGGVAPLFGRHDTELDVDLLLKKPFTLSPTTELMVGAGAHLGPGERPWRA